MRRLWLIRCFVFMVAIAVGCKQSYDPKIPAVKSNNLVVEGFINTNGVTNIALSRSLPLKDAETENPELNAQITITGEDNSTFEVRENGNGNYSSDSLILNVNQKYRLHIKTASGGEYLSEYVAVKPTPEIDSINWKLLNDGVQIYVNTHDPQNNTRYYKWDYEETWEIHSGYATSYLYENGLVYSISSDETEKLYRCWKTSNSSSVLLGSSAQLANDVISEAPITFIPSESEKTSVRYSILIKQYSLDKNGYDFFKLMKSNTESLGSVFDPLPSDITGNITCVSNPLEKVIGYITAATVSEKRIFISSSDAHSTYNQGCSSISVAANVDSFKKYYDGEGLRPYQCDGCPVAKSYYSSTRECIDCTLRGSSTKPSFW